MPRLKCETRNIDGLDVTVQEFGVFRQAALSVRLGKLIAPAAGRIDLAAGLRGDALEGLGEVLLAADPVEVESLIRDMFASTAVIDRTDPTKPEKYELIDNRSIEECFNGRFALMLRALSFVVAVNFAASFAGALRGIAARGAADSKAKANGSNSPRASTRARGVRGDSGLKGKSA